MVSRFERDMTMAIASTVQITKFNEKNGELPFQLICSENDKIVWTCGIDEQNQITSVFSFKGNDTDEEDKKMQYLETKEKAEHVRDELLKNGWIPSKTPDTTITYPGMEPITVGDVKLNRRQKRNFPKLMKNLTSNGDRKNKKRKD